MKMIKENHKCLLGLGSDSMLPRAIGKWASACRRLRKLTQVSEHHPYTYNYFFSFPAVMAERQRHLYEAPSFIIHPFSLFSLIWNSMMIIVDLLHMFLSTFRLAYVVQPPKEMKLHAVDHVLLTLYVVCIADIIIHFNTGYVENRDTSDRELVLERDRICCHYLRRWFFIDLISCLPMSYILLVFFRHETRVLLAGHLMPILRLVKISIVARNMKVFIKVGVMVFTRNYIFAGLVHHITMFALSVHVCSCLIYSPPIFSLYWYQEISSKHSNFLLDSGTETGPRANGMMAFPISYRYERAIFISISAFFVFLLKAYMTIYSSTIRYNELMNQVEEYMKIKQFPSSLKKRVRTFYIYRFQRHYFSEDSVLSSISDELRNEITLHTCYKLVNKVALFEDLPARVVGSVLGCLHPEVYLPNDSVVHAGDIGECMFFIASGTVAVFSLKGVEVCHLEDGAHFGEVALLMKDNKRVATVVAVEITELYRLDAADFRQFILTNELLYQRIEALASKRMNETVLLDEEYNKEWEQAHEKQSTTSIEPMKSIT